MSSRWKVVVSAPGHSWVVELPHARSAIVGQAEGVAVEVPDARLSERHLSLLPREDGVVVEPLRGGGEVLVNDVPVSAQAVVRAGDEVGVGDARLLFTRLHAVPAAPPRIAGEDEFMHRLGEESRRALGQRPLALAVVSSPHLNVTARQALTRRVLDEVFALEGAPFLGQLSLDLLAIALPEIALAALRALFDRLPQVAGPRAAVVSAVAPDDGLDAEGLLGVCFDALADAPAQEPAFTDPVMVRLGALAERLADDEGAVCVVGPAGSGRATLLSHLARAAGRRLTPVAPGEEPRLRSGDWALLEDVERVPKPALEGLLAQLRTRVLATAARPPAGHHFAHVLELPPLRERPDDVLPLAEAFVSRFRAAVGRPRLTLSAEARALLQSWQWPGNVRELANVLFRAARATARDEIGRDALPARLSGESEVGHFRGAMDAAERELLLETLARTRWNVSAAAARLGMPRRTLVHRMGKLGLKRPAR
jgi:hypothetical protein